MLKALEMPSCLSSIHRLYHFMTSQKPKVMFSTHNFACILVLCVYFSIILFLANRRNFVFSHLP
jgi:hypothetical protein